MRRIYKYHLEVISGGQSIELPEGALLVHSRVSADSESIFLWFEVRTEQAPVRRRFEVFPTGVDINHGKWLATVSLTSLELVWHVYEVEHE